MEKGGRAQDYEGEFRRLELFRRADKDHREHDVVDLLLPRVPMVPVGDPAKNFFFPADRLVYGGFKASSELTTYLLGGGKRVEVWIFSVSSGGKVESVGHFTGDYLQGRAPAVKYEGLRPPSDPGRAAPWTKADAARWWADALARWKELELRAIKEGPATRL